MTRKDRMEHTLRQALSPTLLDIVDQSAAHQGHRGTDAQGESHYHITVVSDVFENVNKLARHRQVNALLKDEFDKGLHALSLTLMSPAES